MARRRNKRRQSEDRRGTIYIIAAVVGFILLGGAAIYVRVIHTDIDKVTGCPTSGQIDSVTAILVDMTDNLGPVQAASLRNALIAARDSTPQFGRLEIYALGPITTKPLEPIFAGCNPGTKETAANPIYQNQSMAANNWKTKFADKIDETLLKIEQLKPQNSSPILEGIQSVSVTSLGAPQFKSADRRLIIVSDLIQHGPDLSMFQGAPEFEKFKDTQFFSKIRPNLHRAKVELIWIPRVTRKSVQTPKLKDFWLKFIDSGNGEVVRWAPLA